MLKLISKSTNRKLGKCASTYRAGDGNNFGTCPNSCCLKPANATGSDEIDLDYLDAVVEAVPEDGVSWTYTHFSPHQVPLPSEGMTVINISCDSYEQAAVVAKSGYPATVTVPSSHTDKLTTVDGVKVIRCPAELIEAVSCETCGGSIPLCARGDRDYIIKFTAHGTHASLVGSDKPGGCYGSSGPVAIHWKRASQSLQERTDGEVLLDWVKTLPKGTKLRHHVVGDLGLQQRTQSESL